MKKLIILILAVVFLLSISPVHALTNITTPRIPGCVSSLKFNATNHTELYIGGSTEFNVTIWDVKCGIKHVTMHLENIPEDWYNTSPELIASVAPFQAKDFTVKIDLPSNISPNGYVGNYTIYTEERNFRQHELYIKVLEYEVPEELPKINDSVEEPEPKEEPVEDIYSNNKTLSIFIVIIIITAMIYLVYAGKLKPKKKEEKKPEIKEVKAKKKKAKKKNKGKKKSKKKST